MESKNVLCQFVSEVEYNELVFLIYVYIVLQVCMVLDNLDIYLDKVVKVVQVELLLVVRVVVFVNFVVFNCFGNFILEVCFVVMWLGINLIWVLLMVLIM